MGQNRLRAVEFLTQLRGPTQPSETGRRHLGVERARGDVHAVMRQQLVTGGGVEAVTDDDHGVEGVRVGKETAKVHGAIDHEQARRTRGPVTSPGVVVAGQGVAERLPPVVVMNDQVHARSRGLRLAGPGGPLVA